MFNFYFGRKAETAVQYTFENFFDRIKYELKRSKNKRIAYIINRIKWHYCAKYKILPKFPLNIDIEASSTCELKCDHCFRQYMDMRENRFMKFDLYKKIIDECAAYGLFTLKFSMRGEPTSDKDLPEKVAYAKKMGIKEVWINTHGANLNEEFTTKLLKAKPDWITVSIDGLDEMYESIRKPMKFQTIFENAKRLKRLRDELSPDTMLNTQGLWSAIKHDPKKYYQTLKPFFDRVAYNMDMNFKEIDVLPDPDYVCPRLWLRMAITSEGDVLKCPSDFEKDEVMGNLMFSSVKFLWDVEQEKNRELHLAKRKNESIPCKKCHHGAKIVPKKNDLGIMKAEATNYQFRKKFEGVGLNRQKQITHQKDSN